MKRETQYYLILSLIFITIISSISSCFNREDFINNTEDEDISNNIPPKDMFEPPDVSSNGYISSVEPDKGSVKGNDRITITGKGFEQGAKVLFGVSEAFNVVILNDKEIKCDNPPHPPGNVRVKIINPSKTEISLESGFTYTVLVAISSISPTAGPSEGGTPVKITGSGFMEGTKILIGDRLLIDQKTLSENTIIGISAGGGHGYQDIIVANSTGIFTFPDGFLYGTTPLITSCVPSVVKIDEPATVHIYGEDLDGVDAVYADGKKIEADVITENRIDAEINVSDNGAVDIVLSSPFGDYFTGGCVYALDGFAPDKPLEILNIFPSKGSTKGGEEVVLTITGLKSIENIDFLDPVKGLKVFFGDKQAAVKFASTVMNRAIVLTPPFDPGIYDLKVMWGMEEDTLSDAFSYYRQLTIKSINPSSGSSSGGTEVAIDGEGFTGTDEVRIGAFKTAYMEVTDDDRITAETSKGSAGSVDVFVHRSDGISYTLKGSFSYIGEGFELFAVSPAAGAIAGGTYVEIYGINLAEAKKVFFGDWSVNHIAEAKSNMLAVYSPRSENVGTVDIKVVLSDSTILTLKNAFTYFDPKGYYGGTWGGPVDGSVNVSVIDASNGKPVPLAFVILDSNPDTKFKGLTDSRGQITFSAKNLKGPRDVTATHEDYDTYTVAGFDAQNVTIFLYPKKSSSSGSTEEVEPLKDGFLTGTIVGADKYILIPPADCLKKQIVNGDLCSPCFDDSECSYGAGSCKQIGDYGTFCTKKCKSLKDCPDGYACFFVGKSENRCLPLRGKKEVRCDTSRRTIFSAAKDPGMGFKANEKGIFSIQSRLGEVAVYCIGGIRNFDTGEFEPQIMGVKRHVNVPPGEELSGNDIYLDILLDRAMTVRLNNPPESKKDGGYIRRLETYLDLGSDGVIPIVPVLEIADSGLFYVTNLPENFSGNISDATYTFLAEAIKEHEWDLPYSDVFLREIVPEEGGDIQSLDENGKAVKEYLTRKFNIMAAAAMSDGRIIAVGEGGVALIYDGLEWTENYLPAGNALYGIHAVSDSAVAVGTRGTIYLFKNNTWIKQVSHTLSDLKSIHGLSDTSLFAAGEDVMLQYNGTEWKKIDFSKKADLQGIYVSSDKNIWAVGRYGTIIYYNGIDWLTYQSPTVHHLASIHGKENAPVFAVGDRGTILRFENNEWEKMKSPTEFALNAVFVAAKDLVYAAGAGGTLLKYDGESWKNLSAGQGNEEFTGISVYEKEGKSTPLFFGMNTIFTPEFIWYPEMSNPPENGKWNDLLFSWKKKGGAEADYTLIYFYDLTEYAMWTVLAEGSLENINLPDLSKAGGLKPLNEGDYNFYIRQIDKDEFDFNNFDETAYYYDTWKAMMMKFIRFRR
jgi:photosystem II stability/assembly factor-like uncharacterized protein